MLVQPTNHVVAMEADTCAGVGESSEVHPEASCWNNWVAEFADIFEPGIFNGKFLFPPSYMVK